MVTVSNMNCKVNNGNRQQSFRFFLNIVKVNLEILKKTLPNFK
ncbi:hypothetical protein CHCC20333_0491 [Bacillus paralicheniformis]|nr:hypothetical protein CHCC20333_0491 [Bacillus paralicheniformis]